MKRTPKAEETSLVPTFSTVLASSPEWQATSKRVKELPWLRLKRRRTGRGEGGPLGSQSTTRADRGYISRLGKRDGRSSNRLGERDSNGEGDEDYLGLEEKIPWIRLRKKTETGGDTVPWVRLKKAGRVIVDGGEEEDKFLVRLINITG